MKRKSVWLLAAALAIVVLVLAACGGQEVVKTVVVTQVVEKEGEKVVVTQIVEVTPEPEKKEFKSSHPDTLVVAGIGDADTLDPAWNYESQGDEVIMNIYDQLITYNREKATEFVPSIAEKWEISEDGTTYTFYIRKGIKFQNGNDLTPEDVAYSFQRGILQGGGWSPQWLFTEPFFGTGIYDIAELVNPDAVDDAEALKQEDPAKLQEVCERVVNEVITYDNENWTVTFKLAQPWAPFLATLAQSWGSIIDKDWAIENGTWDGDCATWQNYYGVDSETTPLAKVTNGTGPYMLDHWTPGEEIVLKRNPNFWREELGVPLFEGGPTAPSIETIVIKIVPEWGTRFAMLQAGDADFAGVPRQNIVQADALVGEVCTWNTETEQFDCAPHDEHPDERLRLWKGFPTVTRTDAFFVFNINTEGGNPYIGSGQLDGNGIPPNFFSDIHVRKAFNYCFDWDTYIQDALAGEGIQNVGPLIPGVIGYDPTLPHYSYDPDKCVEELQQAWDGQVWEKGFRFQIVYNTGNVTRQTVAQILQASFADIDPKFRIEVVALPWPAFLREVRASRTPIFVSGWIEDIHDPHNWAQPFLIGTYASRQNMPEDLKAQFADLVNQGVAETDPAKRAEIYKQLTQLDYENAPAIRLAVVTGRHYEQRWVEGWYYNPIAPAFYMAYSIAQP